MLRDVSDEAVGIGEYFGETTGDEGASFERTYPRAAFVLWPRENFLSVLASADLDDSLAYLQALVERAVSPDDRARASGLADAIAMRLVEASWLPRCAGPTPAARLLAAYRRLDQVAGVENCFLRLLPVPPGNCLEALVGDRAGQHSVRINDQWRICFFWIEGGPSHVTIVDYHH